MNLKKYFKRDRITRIQRRDIIDPKVIKALRDISNEAKKAQYGLMKTQKAMRHLNHTINEVFWKRAREEYPEQKGDNSGQSIDVIGLSEKKKKVICSFDHCSQEWNTKLKITHWTYLPKDP